MSLIDWPASALPRAPHWLMPTPWPLPRPKSWIVDPTVVTDFDQAGGGCGVGTGVGVGEGAGVAEGSGVGEGEGDAAGSGVGDGVGVGATVFGVVEPATAGTGAAARAGGTSVTSRRHAINHAATRRWVRACGAPCPGRSIDMLRVCGLHPRTGHGPKGYGPPDAGTSMAPLR